MSTFKPLLAAKVDGEDFDKLVFPMIATPKIDGIRCMIRDGVAVSRKLKPIPNQYVQDQLKGLPDGFDGELVTYTDGKIDDFNTVQSKVMSGDGQPAFVYHVFDDFTDPGLPYHTRLKKLQSDIGHFIALGNYPVDFVPYTYCESFDQLADLEHEFIDNQGWEGVMLRYPGSIYKYGRSTLSQGILLKVKRFDDAEAVIIGFEELMHNHNKAEIDALGHTKRSSHQENKVPGNTMGTMKLRWPQENAPDVEFEIGTGFTEAMRQDFWNRRDELIGSTVTFKFQGIGSQGRPRFPVFLGIRHDVTVA